MTYNELLTTVQKRDVKFIIVTGGVCSSIGKGVLTASLGVLLKSTGATVSVMKWDPYLNVDPGTMSPLVHGEVFVTDDGAETDLDLGHYERLIGVHLTRDSSVSSGQIFHEILQKERTGAFLGDCIQLVPHVVDAIKERLLRFALKTGAEFILVEIGGTVGDMEADVFLEAIRQIRMQLANHHMFHAHLSYVPYLSWANEVKTKLTQHSVMLLKKAGLVPDCLFLRTERSMQRVALEKVSTMCGVRQDLVFQVMTRNPIFRVFADLERQGVSEKIQEWFGVQPARPADIAPWLALIKRIDNVRGTVRVGLIAKYIGSSDPYKSVIEAVKAAAYACDYDVDIVTIAAEHLEQKPGNEEQYQEAIAQLHSVDGVVMPGGFDKRGIEGKIYAVNWALEQRKPYLGLCLGLQVMLIALARLRAGIAEATSSEFDGAAAHPIIALLDEQKGVVSKGASMRLGLFPCTLKPQTKAWLAYGADVVEERHRHRYEFNNAYREQLEKVGVVFSGMYRERDLVEIAEIKDHPFMLGSQFHPEFLSTPLRPHPLFKAFLEAIIVQKSA